MKELILICTIMASITMGFLAFFMAILGEYEDEYKNKRTTTKHK